MIASIQLSESIESTWLDTPETKETALDFLYNITNALEHNDNKHVDKEATTEDHNRIIGPGEGFYYKPSGVW